MLKDEPSRRKEAISQFPKTMRDCVPFFPENAPLTVALMATLEQMCETSDQVQWLAGEVILRWPKWKSIAELRALYCTRFAPWDGEVPAFACEDVSPEDEYMERQRKETTARIAQWKKEQAALPAPEREEMQREIALLESGIKAAVQPIVPPSEGPCPLCSGSGRLKEGGYCECQMGRDLKFAERPRKRIPERVPEYPSPRFLTEAQRDDTWGNP